MPPDDAIHVVRDVRFREHRPPDGHPERPERLAAVDAVLDARSEALHVRAPRPAEDDELLRIHAREHVQAVHEASEHAPSRLDPDTWASASSEQVARLAAGGTIDLALAIARGEARRGIAAVRPPGHHAEAARPMGFCLFNNVALATRAVQQQAGLDKVLVYDWDVHHGNGTQHSFEDDPSVLYASTHQFPYYPGTGAAGEAGRGHGEGATLNIPLPAGCGDREYTGVCQRLLVPVARDFGPELIVVSCGFDAHADDPLASMEVSGAGYLALTRIVRALADELCDGRLLFVLEGGYSLLGLEEGTNAVLDGLADDAPPPPAADLEPGSTLKDVLDRVRAVHGSRHPDLGTA